MKSFLIALVTLFVSACSGSIFSEGGSSPNPSNNASPQATPPANSSNTPDRNIVQQNDPNPSPSPQNGRVVNDVETLNIYEILAPVKMSEWTERMNEQQEKDFLAQLGLRIVIGKIQKTETGRSVRNVDFFISKDSKNVSNGSNPKAPWVTIPMEVNKDITKEDLKTYMSGYLQSPDYPAPQSPFIALSLSLTKNGNGYKVNKANFVEYVNGDPKHTYRLNNNTNITISIL